MESGDSRAAPLQLLLDSFVAIAAERHVDAILEQAVDFARLSTQARYGAGAVVWDGEVSQYVQRGLSAAQLEALPKPAAGAGVIGALLEGKSPIRVERMQADSRLADALDTRVPMAAFLGIPMFAEQRVLGALYLAKAPGEGVFTEHDELFMEALARQAATAIAASRALDQRDEEISERKRTDVFVQLLQVIAMAANSAKTLEEALAFAIDEVCTRVGWPVGHVYLYDEGRDALVPTNIWHLDNPERFATFRRVTQKTVVPSGLGLTGRVHLTGKPAWIYDMQVEPGQPRALSGEGIGVRGAFGFPVAIGPDVVAVLEFFSPDPADPDDELLDLMGNVGTQLGRVVERIRAQDAQRQHATDLERANAELQALNELKSDFLATVSHELLTPLTPILGFAALLTRQWQGLSDEQRLQFALEIETKARSLATLIDEVLIMARLEGRTVHARQQRVGLHDVVERAARHFPGYEVSVLIDVPDDLDVLADREHLQRIVSIYIDNALKYGRAPVRVASMVAAGGVELRVCDDGDGVPEDFVPYLFEKFSQASTGSTRTATGLGLGLSVARGLAGLQAGDVWYERVTDGGACFAVRIAKAGPLTLDS
ncbi:MAG: GAF domain-containing sensor histidine kinase [Mycobacteriales bacterium]